ncbi:MAG: hypothetical protein U0176_03895 [Bacteroidia bacterium]
MNQKHFFIASAVTYVILSIILSRSGILVFFFNTMACATMLGSHLLLLFSGEWTQPGTEKGDRSLGPTFLVTAYTLLITKILTKWLFLLSPSYTHPSVVEGVSWISGIIVGASILTLDLAVLRKRHSLQRRGWLLLFCIVIGLGNGILGNIADATHYGENGTRFWWDRLENSFEFLGYLITFVYPIVWLIVPSIYLLWKKSELEAKTR